LVKELIDAGVHFGHRSSRWNPKMKPYIYGKRNQLHIIDVKQTLRGLLVAKKFITQVVAGGKDVLFVGTKRQARKSIQKHADRVEMHWVNDRWLGGTLTNFREIRRRLGRLFELEQLEADGLLDQYSKKEGSRLRREMRKIQRNLGGLRKMEKFPGVLVVVDQVHEMIAIREAKKAGIPVICLLDTDGDPEVVDIPIPGNDDAMRSIEVIVRELADAVQAGMGVRTEGADQDEDKPQPKRRSKRPTTARAQDEDDNEEYQGEESAEAPAEEEAAKPESTRVAPVPAQQEQNTESEA
jgi:small subunit ribosomal protein S2